MAGFYLIIGNNDKARIQQAEKRITYFPNEKSAVIIESDFCCVWVGINDPVFWAPSYDPKTGVRIITTGRYPLSQSEWDEANNIKGFTGGIVSRFLIKRYLDKGINYFKRPDGATILIIYDPRESTLHIFSDHFGYYPIYKFENRKRNEIVLSSSPDAIANDHHIKTSLDEISFVEFLSAWRVTPPNTYYKEIKYFGAAKHFCYETKKKKYSEELYWNPFTEGFYTNFDEASEDLEFALKSSIGKRTLTHLGPMINFTSGGMDSRAVLFSASDPEQIIALNLFDKPNLESSITQQLCNSCNVRYIGFGRDSEYYPRLMKDNVMVSNGLGSLEDHHYLGTRKFIKALGANSVMSACSTDWLFKGYGLEKKYKQFLGKNLPIMELSNSRVKAFLPNLPLPVPAIYKKEVAERFDSWFNNTPENFSSERDWLIVEDLRVRPTAYAVSISGPGMYRMFPYDTFLGSIELADCYSKIPPKWKLNSLLWGKTVERMGGNAGKILDANSGSRTGAPITRKLVDFSKGWINRHTAWNNTSSEQKLATNYSWPNFTYLISNSELLKKDWIALYPMYKDRLETYTDLKLEVDTPIKWKGEHHLFFRIITLLHWFNQIKL